MTTSDLEASAFVWFLTNIGGNEPSQCWFLDVRILRKMNHEGKGCHIKRIAFRLNGEKIPEGETTLDKPSGNSE